MDKPIRPEEWHNIPKCVCDAIKWLVDKQKYDSGKMQQQQGAINRIQDSTARKETKVQRKFDELQKMFNSQLEVRSRKADADLQQLGQQIVKCGQDA